MCVCVYGGAEVGCVCVRERAEVVLESGRCGCVCVLRVGCVCAGKG